MFDSKDIGRMIDWLLWAMLCYVAVFVLKQMDAAPQAQTVLWKLGNLTVAAWSGYWIDRRAFRSRISHMSGDLEQLRRAIIIAAAMLTVGLGL